MFKRNQDRTLEFMNKLKLNNQTADEFLSVEGDHVAIAIGSVTEKIESLRYSTGRKVRAERRKSMIKVLEALYSFMNTETGECSPSMRTIAFYLDPTLPQVKDTDSEAIIMLKEKAVAPLLMNVHRTIRALEEFGFIVSHEYRAESNRNDNPETPNLKNPNFYYELAPVSELSEEFAKMVQPVGVEQVITTVFETICETFTDIKERAGLLVNDFIETAIHAFKPQEAYVVLLE
jgi:hypothetical protein